MLKIHRVLFLFILRDLLCQIVGIKMRMFDTYKFRSQTAEEYLRKFLENEVKVLWPQGWIQTRLAVQSFFCSFCLYIFLSISFSPDAVLCGHRN